MSEKNDRPRSWIRENPLPATVLALAPIVGPMYTMWAFPDVELWRHAVGGLIAGGYFALCAIPQRFM